MLIIRDILAALTCLIFSIFFSTFQLFLYFLFVYWNHLFDGTRLTEIKQDRVKNSELKIV